MIKRTLYFGNPSYLSLSDGQLLLRLPGKQDLQDFDGMCVGANLEGLGGGCRSLHLGFN